MTRALALLLLTLAPTLAAADEDWYDTGSVLLSRPILVSTARNALVAFDVPNYGPGVVVQQATPRSCKKWERAGHPEWANPPDEIGDEDDLSITPHRSTDYLRGHFVFVLRLRNAEPATGWVCLRLPFVRGYAE